MYHDEYFPGYIFDFIELILLENAKNIYDAYSLQHIT